MNEKHATSYKDYILDKYFYVNDVASDFLRFPTFPKVGKSEKKMKTEPKKLLLLVA